MNPFASPQYQEPAHEPIVDEDPQQAELRAFVGSNARYYLSRWMRTGKYRFNWAAFFLGPMWMAYRKMYLVTAGYLGLWISLVVGAAVVFGFILVQEVPPMLERGASIGLAIGCGLLANGLYLKHAQRAIARVHTEVPKY